MSRNQVPIVPAYPGLVTNRRRQDNISADRDNSHSKAGALKVSPVKESAWPEGWEERRIACCPETIKWWSTARGVDALDVAQNKSPDADSPKRQGRDGSDSTPNCRFQAGRKIWEGCVSWVLTTMLRAAARGFLRWQHQRSTESTKSAEIRVTMPLTMVKASSGMLVPLG